MGVCKTSSHLHILSSSHLHIFHIFSSSHPHIFHIFSSSHLLIFSSSHLLIFTSSHLHIFSSSHLLLIFSSSHPLIFTSSYLHIFSSSHLLIFTSSHLYTSSHLLTSSHIFSHLLTSCPLALLPSCFLLLFYFSFEGGEQGQCQRDATKRNPFARNEVRSPKTEVKLRFPTCPRNPFRTK